MSESAPVSIRDEGRALVATVEQSDLSAEITDALLEQLRRSVQANAQPLLIVDLARVKFIDSVALGALVVLLRRAKQSGGRLALAGLGGHARNVLQVTGLERVFELFADVPAALAEFAAPA